MRFLSHLTFPKIVAFLMFGAVLVSFAPRTVLGTSLKDISLSQAVTTRTGSTIPAGSYGIVHLNKAKEGQLLHLRGIAGSGYLILRSKEAGLCQEAPVELVAGDFGGNRIGISATGPITLAIASRSVAEALQSGNEIQSEDLAITDRIEDATADVILIKGLHLSHGFVIDPAHSFMNDLFGIRFRKVQCVGSFAKS